MADAVKTFFNVHFQNYVEFLGVGSIELFRLSAQTSSKSSSSKKIPETDAIFEQLATVNQYNDYHYC